MEARRHLRNIARHQHTSTSDLPSLMCNWICVWNCNFAYFQEYLSGKVTKIRPPSLRRIASAAVFTLRGCFSTVGHKINWKKIGYVHKPPIYRFNVWAASSCYQSPWCARLARMHISTVGSIRSHRAQGLSKLTVDIQQIASLVLLRQDIPVLR